MIIVIRNHCLDASETDENLVVSRSEGASPLIGVVECSVGGGFKSQSLEEGGKVAFLYAYEGHCD